MTQKEIKKTSTGCKVTMDATIRKVHTKAARKDKLGLGLAVRNGGAGRDVDEVMKEVEKIDVGDEEETHTDPPGKLYENQTNTSPSQDLGEPTKGGNNRTQPEDETVL
ncbi:hypothetical protein Pmani_039538 [Petrolisthes manimaculis]|uniref:Uncharacterized protein n=1 Tax=Petrolisthes manimaculis TaxID=1843537 RepID=A0AAE1TL92_9EUCA|nr:hypothetical protein Pmani_039538 [Petrolisthes manimaculis]